MREDNKVLRPLFFERYIELVFRESGPSGVLAIPKYLWADGMFGNTNIVRSIIDGTPIDYRTCQSMIAALNGEGHLPLGFTMKQRGEALNTFTDHSVHWYEEVGMEYFFYVRFIGEYVGIPPGGMVDYSQFDGIDWGSYGRAVARRLQEL